MSHGDRKIELVVYPPALRGGAISRRRAGFYLCSVAWIAIITYGGAL